MARLTRLLSSIALGLSVLLGTGLAPVHAAELTPTQVNRVMSLLESFKTEQAVIDRVRKALTESPREEMFCYMFNTNLGMGASGAPATALQKALLKDGQVVIVTNVFDAQTAAAVRAYQEKYAAEILVPLGLTRGTGYVGSSTRVRLNKLYYSTCVATTLPVSASASTTAAVTASSSATSTAISTSGTLDYNNDKKLDQADTQLLLETAVSARACGAGKVCDLNKDGKVLASDALVLANFVGSAAKVGQLDYNQDYKITAEDATLLGEIAVGTRSCPAGRVCDVTGDQKVNMSDALALAAYLGN
jgi:hypothetical protein